MSNRNMLTCSFTNTYKHKLMAENTLSIAYVSDYFLLNCTNKDNANKNKFCILYSVLSFPCIDIMSMFRT